MSFPSFAVKVSTVDPKSRLRDISREVAQKGGEMRGMHVPRKDSERSGQRKPESYHRGRQSPGGQALIYKRLTFRSCSLYVTACQEREGLRPDVTERLPSSLMLIVCVFAWICLILFFITSSFPCIWDTIRLWCVLFVVVDVVCS